MLLRIHHRTGYAYDQNVNYTIQILRLWPRAEEGQQWKTWNINAPGNLLAQKDAFGNTSHLLTLDRPHQEIMITVDGEIETSMTHTFHDDGALPVALFLHPTPLTQPEPAIQQFVRECAGMDGIAIPEALMKLMVYIHRHVRYQPGATDVSSSAAEALQRGAGVCQDHAHVLISCAKIMGWPARYVSGYLWAGDDPSHLASHAWADIWDAQQNLWLSCDTTHTRFTGGGNYCRLAVGRDYLDACPIRGVRRGGGMENLSATVFVTQINEINQ